MTNSQRYSYQQQRQQQHQQFYTPRNDIVSSRISDADADAGSDGVPPLFDQLISESKLTKSGGKEAIQSFLADGSFYERGTGEHLVMRNKSLLIHAMAWKYIVVGSMIIDLVCVIDARSSGIDLIPLALFADR